MTIHTEIECNICGVTVKPEAPRPILGVLKAPTTGWSRLMVIGADGIQFVDSDGDLCERCREKFHAWGDEQRKLAGRKPS